MPSPNRRVVVIQPDLWEEISLRANGRQSHGRALESMLRRYLEIITEAASEITVRFTPAEVQRIGALLASPGSGSIGNKLARERFRHPDDTGLKALSDKVGALSLAEQVALTDMLERAAS